MKKLFYVIMGGAMVVASSCKKDVSGDLEKSGPNAPAITVTLTGSICAPVTINPGDNVFLDGIVYVCPGVTLTIPAGTIVTGKTTACGTVPDLVNLANNKGTLVVRKGAKLIANGTATNPIVWTSANPAGSRNVGDWGGIVILGNAPIKLANGSVTNNFEAFVALTNGFNSYGGTTANDNSGSITYNRVEFGGGTITAPNAEVNGLTLCGVGCGTTLNHIEVSNSGDDGFQFFGGTVNADHLLSFANKDEDYDFVEGYNGNLQFIIAFRTDRADNSGSKMIELDGNATAVPTPVTTNPIIVNATLVGPASSTVAANCGGVTQNGRFDAGITVRRQAVLTLANSYVIAQAMPAALVFAPTTGTPPSLILNTIFQSNSAITLPGIIGANNNSLLPDFAAFGLGVFLENTPASPGFTGGFNAGGITLGACAFPLVGTNERGAVPSTDVWTNKAWISIATN